MSRYLPFAGIPEQIQYQSLWLGESNTYCNWELFLKPLLVIPPTEISYETLHACLPLYARILLPRPSPEEMKDDLRSNYERYRAVILNGFHGVGEHEALAKIDVEEMYPEKKGVGKEKHK